MSGDTQPKKRKDKKRKKDDEDLVKETTVHAPKQPSGGAAQAAKEPSDVQMHIHSDHGTGGHWCAKVVFFILLAGLGALIGLIIMENQGVSNEDTPLSESRYSEFFNGWVDETRQDDHHHEEILAAINSLDDHDDHDDGGVEHAIDDHDDEHDQDDGEDDDHDDGAPYAEQDDHDDDEDGEQEQDEDDEDGEAAQKLDDDEVEEIFAQHEAAARQEAFTQAQGDDDDDDDNQTEDDDVEDDDDGANDKLNTDDDNDNDDDDLQNEATIKYVQDNDDNDDDDEDDSKIDIGENEQDSENNDVVTKIAPGIDDVEPVEDDNDDNDFDEDGDDDDDDENEAKIETATVENDTNDDEDDDEDNEEVENNEDDDDELTNNLSTKNVIENDADNDDDNDDEIAQEIDQIVRSEDDQDGTPFDEETLPNALSPSPKLNIPLSNAGSSVDERLETYSSSASMSETADLKVDQKQQTTTPFGLPVTGDTLKNQMDELVRNFNKLAESLDVPLVEDTNDTLGSVEQPFAETPLRKDDDNDDDEDEEEIQAIKRGSELPNAAESNDDADDNDDDDDDTNDDFNDFVDNDGGEEEYLAKLRTEQQRRVIAEEERKAAVEPEEETSQKSSMDDTKTRIDSVSICSATPSSGEAENAATQISTTTSVNLTMDDFTYSGPVEKFSHDHADVIEKNVIILDEMEDAEHYSGDEYDYELDDLEEELEEVEAEEDEQEKLLIEQEQEIGAFVPITFEDFKSMYRSPADLTEQPLEDSVVTCLETQSTPNQYVAKKVTKESPLARKKPPKGAVNKLIYGLHKDPIVIPSDEEGKLTTAEAGENVSAKGEAKTVLTALLSEIPSPPIDLDHEFDKLVPTGSTIVRPTGTGTRQRQSLAGLGKNEKASIHPSREKHVEFQLPEEEPEYDSEPPAERVMEWFIPEIDKGSKENLFVPDASEAEMEAIAYVEEYGQYEGEEEDDIIYEDEEELDDIESVLLNQYGSDEEEEPLTDDNIPAGAEDDDASDVDDSDLMRRLEQKYGKLPAASNTSTAMAHVEAASQDGEDDEAVAAGWTKIPTRAEEADRSYQEELRRSQQQLDENKVQEALASFERIVERKSNSIAALIGKAQALDALAEQRRSNKVLTEAIVAYRKVIAQELAVDDVTLKGIAERCIDRMRFQGQHAKAIEIHEMLIRRFDDEPHYRNQLAVTYLHMNRLPDAKAVLHETLHRWIEDGFALVHYGFVLKMHDHNMELAAQYLREGIESGHEGTQDGRFYFQLGDALQRLGRNLEALEIYQKGVEKKLFLSVYQRSLYNVNGLRSRPFWTVEQTTYAAELEHFRAQWMSIRDEGLKLLNAHGVFVNESENLRDRGDWKQLELFSRGARVERNCARAPLTCRLVEQHLPAARTCKRGQVKFSVMHPGTHVWPHCGPTNCRIRAHLGLNVPDGTHIRVAKETRSWSNGKWLIFDDSFEHEVWHNGTATRLVLIVDLWHPDLTENQRLSLSPI